ncbi:restriction endonuclease subunit S [Bradyrhizobium sp. OAE829]|uniref:restriction endonuclease subunit S n=1 Tax=Bradyrhizobium sp. OAE829 TaxID=2663807 RepID=UPI001789632F
MTQERFESWPLPKGWACVRFEDVAEIAQNLVSPSKVPDLPHIAPNHIGSGNRQLLPYSTVRADAVISSKQRFYPGQILFTKIRPYLLKSVLVDFDGVCSADMYPLWTKDTAEPKYLLYWLTSPEFREVIAHEQGRTVLPKINQAALNKSLMALPPLPEQRRIVATIDSLSAKSRRARERLDHIPRLVEKYKQAILAAAFRGELTKNWRNRTGRRFDCESTTLGQQLVDIRYGTAKKCDYEGGAVGVLRIPNVQLGKLQIDDLKSADFTSDELRKLRLEKGDILIIRSNGSLDLVGRSAVVDDAAVGMLFAGYLIRLRLDANLVIPEYAQLYLQATTVRELVERLAKSTSGVNNINSTQLQELPFLRPSMDEQREIVRVIGVAFSWIDRLASEATSARKLIDHLDQAILAKAFRGELVPQDPNDEPASVLLERITAERKETARPRSRKRHGNFSSLATTRSRRSK